MFGLFKKRNAPSFEPSKAQFHARDFAAAQNKLFLMAGLIKHPA